MSLKYEPSSDPLHMNCLCHPQGMDLIVPVPSCVWPKRYRKDTNEKTMRHITCFYRPGADLIVAADCTYYKDYIPPLMRVVIKDTLIV